MSIIISCQTQKIYSGQGDIHDINNLTRIYNVHTSTWRCTISGLDLGSVRSHLKANISGISSLVDVYIYVAVGVQLVADVATPSSYGTHVDCACALVATFYMNMKAHINFVYLRTESSVCIYTAIASQERCYVQTVY